MKRAAEYRIGYSVNRHIWVVYDCRPNVAGPFKSRDAALARAAMLNTGEEA